MKNFFFFSVTLILLALASTSAYYLWKYEQDKAAKKERLEKHYLDEIKFNYTEWLNKNHSIDIKVSAYNEIEEIEKQMFQDGFDRAEIASIRKKGRQEAQKYLELCNRLQ